MCHQYCNNYIFLLIKVIYFRIVLNRFFASLGSNNCIIVLIIVFLNLNTKYG